jgi:hypothetical protein
VFIAQTLTVGSAFAAKKPNIVLVFLDNFGWGEPGFNGGEIIRGAATASAGCSMVTAFPFWAVQVSAGIS